MHHAQRQRSVGAGQQSDVLVAFFGGQRAIRIDRNQGRAAPLGLLRAHPEVQVGRDRVTAPDQDQFAILKLLDVGADARAQRVLVADAACRGADGAIKQRRAELVEEARRHRFALHQTHGAGIAVGQHRLRIVRHRAFQPRGDRVERFIPADAGELALALVADPLHRIQQPVRVVSAFGIARHLGTQHAGRGRVLRVAAHLGRDAILDGHQQGAGIGAIMRAGSPDKGRGHQSIRGKNVEKPILYTIPGTAVQVLASATAEGLQ